MRYVQGTRIGALLLFVFGFFAVFFVSSKIPHVTGISGGGGVVYADAPSSAGDSGDGCTGGDASADCSSDSGSDCGCGCGGSGSGDSDSGDSGDCG